MHSYEKMTRTTTALLGAMAISSCASSAPAPTTSRSNGSLRDSGSVVQYDASTVVYDAASWTTRRSDANSPYVPLPGDCLPGTYIGEYECIVSFFGLPFFPWTGSVTLELEAGPGSDDPEFPTLTVAPGAMIGGTDNLNGMFTGEIDGELDCRTRILRGELRNGEYMIPDLGFMATLEGSLQAQYDSGSLGEGEMGPLTSPDAPGAETNTCTWTATRVE